MRLLLALACVLAVATVVSSAPQYGVASSIRNGYRRSRDFAVGAYRGTGDMVRAYNDMRRANWRNSDRYFHARGNRDAASRGAGGRFAASVISNGRELTDRLRGGSAADSARDQAANRLGRRGGDISVYRPAGLPRQY